MTTRTDSDQPTINPPYDSGPETITHMNRVAELLLLGAFELIRRATVHDQAKLGPEEKPWFDRLTPLLRTTTYNSPAYHVLLRELAPALVHHYATYDHHPQHFPNGVYGMGIPAFYETSVDWKAAGERHADGSYLASLEANEDRFHIDMALMNLLANTAVTMGWIPAGHPWRHVEGWTRIERVALARLLGSLGDVELPDTPAARQLALQIRPETPIQDGRILLPRDLVADFFHARLCRELQS